MMHIRRVLSVVAAATALVAASPALLAQQQQNNQQQNRREQEKRSQQEQRDIETLVQLVDAVSAGKQPAPTDIAVAWQSNHFVKGSEGGTYIPYTLNIDASKLAPQGVALYVRAVDKNAAPAQPQQQNNNNNRNQNQNQNQAPVYPWDDINFIQVPANGKIQRALMLKPGQYDLFVAVKERTPQQQQRNAPPLKSGVLRHTLTVPDYNSNVEITTSTPILAQSVMPLATPLGAEEQRANPYTFGGTLQVVPAETAAFKTADDFQLLFWIYGVGDKGGVPDVTIEYNFHVKNPDGTEKFFNKTQPQTLNSTTLPPGFSVQAGHQVLGFLGVPLKSFPAGEYRVEFKITDKISGKTLTQNANFTVQA